MKATIISTVTAGVIALAGCSSSGTHPSAAKLGTTPNTSHASGQTSTVSNSAAKGPDACGLLKDDQVAQAIDATVTEHHSITAGLADSACVWTVKSEVGDIANPTVTIKTEANKQLGSDLDTFGDATRGYKPVENIGDKAAQGQNNQVGPEELVYVVDGVMYTISVQLSGDPVQDEKLDEAIADVAVASSFVPN